MVLAYDDCTAQVQEFVIDYRPVTAATTMSLEEYIRPFQSSRWGCGGEIAEPYNTLIADHKSEPVYSNTLIVDTVESGHAWTREGLQRIAELSTLCNDWHDSDAAAPNQRAVALATDVFRQMSRVDFKPSSIDASTGEGICIHFSSGNRTANIECFNSGEIFAATMKKGGEPFIWEVTDKTTFDGLARIYEFIGG